MAKGSSLASIKNLKREEKCTKNSPLLDNMLFEYNMLLMLSEN